MQLSIEHSVHINWSRLSRNRQYWPSLYLFDLHEQSSTKGLKVQKAGGAKEVVLSQAGAARCCLRPTDRARSLHPLSISWQRWWWLHLNIIIIIIIKPMTWPRSSCKWEILLILQVSFYIIYFQLVQFRASRLPFGVWRPPSCSTFFRLSNEQSPDCRPLSLSVKDSSSKRPRWKSFGRNVD